MSLQAGQDDHPEYRYFWNPKIDEATKDMYYVAQASLRFSKRIIDLLTAFKLIDNDDKIRVIKWLRSKHMNPDIGYKDILRGL